MDTLMATQRPVSLESLHPAFFIGCWMFLSNLTILFNKWLLDTASFKYPAILTWWHLVFSTLATQILAHTTCLLDSRHKVQMTRHIYLRAIVPIGLLYSGSLICSNIVYLYLSVPFIQMLKASAPVAVLFTSWAWGVADPSTRMFYNILLIVAGVGLASFGEIEFSWVGFAFQMGGVIFEAIRLVMIQVLLKGDDAQKMDPVVSLYYFAPICALMNFLVAWVGEFSTFKIGDLQDTGLAILLLNAAVAFMLNVSSVFLIGKTSGLVMTLTSILKNILLIIVSIILWHDSISSLQFVGYGIALLGLVIYSTGWDQLKESGISAAAWARTAWDSHVLDKGHLSQLVEYFIFVALIILIVWVLILGFTDGGLTAPVGLLAKVGTAGN
ncbi:triose-phosphate transporter [Colletotrichum incanum]|nr:triose-phosphate transporter [Colletotrichum incanum]